MEDLKSFFKKNTKPFIAIFLSGTGTNAQKILEYWANDKENCNFIPKILVCDRDCYAQELSQKYDILLIKHDIFKFYEKHNLSSLSLSDEKGQKVRELWTQELMKKLSFHTIDFGIFAGFIPLCNITKVFPCLNIHPGDLSYIRDDKRRLIGLHKKPIYAVIQENLDYMRSSVILANQFEQKGLGMDEGIILGISQKVSIDFLGEKKEFYQKKSYKELQVFLEHNLQKLKIQGDWVIFPEVINDFAQQKFAINNKNSLYYKVNNGTFIPVDYLIYGEKHKKIIFKR